MTSSAALRSRSSPRRRRRRRRGSSDRARQRPPRPRTAHRSRRRRASGSCPFYGGPADPSQAQYPYLAGHGNRRRCLPRLHARSRQGGAGGGPADRGTRGRGRRPRRRDRQAPLARAPRPHAAEPPPGAPDPRRAHDELRERGFEVGPARWARTSRPRASICWGLRGARGCGWGGGGDRVTGLRNPCSQLDGIAPGLMEATLERDDDGGLVRKAGVMAIVLEGGEVGPGRPIAVEPPPGPQRPSSPSERPNVPQCALWGTARDVRGGRRPPE